MLLLSNSQKPGKIRNALCTSLLLIGAPSAHASLILNGGFEAPDIPSHAWRWYPSTQVPGWQGSNIEIWDSFQGMQAIEGEQFAELNAHGQGNMPFSINQTFATTTGIQYQLSFAYAARASTNELFNVEVMSAGGSALLTQDIGYSAVKQWFNFEDVFTAVDEFSTLQFTSRYPGVGTVGNFLDNVQVAAITSSRPPSLLLATNQSAVRAVPEPSTCLLLLGSLFSVWWLNKRKKGNCLKLHGPSAEAEKH